MLVILRHVGADLGDDHPRDRLTAPGYRRQPVGRLAKRAQHLVGLPLDRLHGGAQRVDLHQVQFQQEAMMCRHPAVHRGDDVRAAGLQAPGGAIGQPRSTSANSAKSVVMTFDWMSRLPSTRMFSFSATKAMPALASASRMVTI